MAAMGPSRWLGAGVAVATLVLFSACTSEKTTTAPQQPALSAADATSLGEAMTADAQSELDGATLAGGPFTPGMAGPFGTATTTMCVPTISPSPVVDTDKDAVPDSIRITFPGCAFSEWGSSDTIKGSIDVVDPTPMVLDRDLRLRFLQFARIEVENGQRRSIVVSGMRQALRDPTQITFQDSSFKTVYTFADGSTATSDRNWLATFTPDAGSSIQPDQPLPAGNLAINGTASWTRGSNNFAIDVSTSPPLHYNPSCAARPPFDKGTLTLKVTHGTTTSTVTITFTACGQYTVTRS